MKRLVMKQLLEWKESKYRKPLILKGVRQVGNNVKLCIREKLILC